MKIFIILLLLFTLTSCTRGDLIQQNPDTEKQDKPLREASADKDYKSLINAEGNTVQERIMVPEGFERVSVHEASFAQYLRELPVKPEGTPVKYYDGGTKPREVHAAVLDIDVGDRDLQQCADAVMRLRAEYLYQQGLYDKIHFNFTSGFRADYSTWMKGSRIKVDGNKVSWVQETGYSKEYSSFRKYLDMVFAYAGTLSLSKELQSIPKEDIQIGDVFLKGGSPGHGVIVLDMAENKMTGQRIFIIAQSYMPAQDIHILKNLQDEELSPWYSVDFGETLDTPEWIFSQDQVMRFQE